MARSMANVIPMKAYYCLVSDIPRKINAGPHHIKPGKRSQSNLFRRAKFFAVTADIYFRDFTLNGMLTYRIRSEVLALLRNYWYGSVWI